jgi:hypothetical protein
VYQLITLTVLHFESFRRFFKNHIPLSPDYTSNWTFEKKQINKSMNIFLVLILSFTKNFWKAAYLQNNLVFLKLHNLKML